MPPHYRIGNHGIKWYYHLLSTEERQKQSADSNKKLALGLFDDHPRETINDKIIVHAISPDNQRLFTLFDDLYAYVTAYFKIEPQYRTFFETIIGPQKPHFDIDIDLDKLTDSDGDKIDYGNKVKDQLIGAIIATLQQNNIELQLDKDLLLFSSHGPNKLSYHVVINNYCHSSHKQAEKFFWEVVKTGNLEQYVEPGIIDKSVYKSIQQFRIEGNQKYASNRPKKLNLTWKYNNEDIEFKFKEEFYNDKHEYLNHLEAGLVGYVHGCKFLPTFGTADEIDSNNTEYDEIELDKNDIKLALQRLKDFELHVNGNKHCPFSYRGIEGGMIMLQRHRPSYCQLCRRVHDNEHPFIFIMGKCKSVYFHCRRADPQEKLFITQLRDPKELDVETRELHHNAIIASNSIYEQLKDIRFAENPNLDDISADISEDIARHEKLAEQREKYKQKYAQQNELTNRVAERLAQGQARVNGSKSESIFTTSSTPKSSSSTPNSYKSSNSSKSKSTSNSYKSSNNSSSSSSSTPKSSNNLSSNSSTPNTPKQHCAGVPGAFANSNPIGTGNRYSKNKPSNRTSKKPLTNAEKVKIIKDKNKNNSNPNPILVSSPKTDKNGIPLL